MRRGLLGHATAFARRHRPLRLRSAAPLESRSAAKSRGMNWVSISGSPKPATARPDLGFGSAAPAWARAEAEGRRLVFLRRRPPFAIPDRPGSDRRSPSCPRGAARRTRGGRPSPDLAIGRESPAFSRSLGAVLATSHGRPPQGGKRASGTRPRRGFPASLRGIILRTSPISKPCRPCCSAPREPPSLFGSRANSLT